jgi:HD-like signal output (HDOD) protein
LTGVAVERGGDFPGDYLPLRAGECAGNFDRDDGHGVQVREVNVAKSSKRARRGIAASDGLNQMAGQAMKTEQIMTQTTRSLSDWIAFLDQAELPVLKHSARELVRMRGDDSLLNAHDVAAVVSDDPLLAVKLLRYMQRHKHRAAQGDLIGVTQSLLILGLDAFFRDVPASPVVEDGLRGHLDALVNMLHTVRRAQRAAYYAYDWSLRMHELHAEEVLLAALLSHLGEMLMWCFNPEPMLDIYRRQLADPSLRSADIQQQVLGFTGMAFQRELTQRWQLPELLQQMTDPALAHTPRVRNVMLAVNLARHSANGWDNPALPDDIQQIAVLLRMEPDKVLALVRAHG